MAIAPRSISAADQAAHAFRRFFDELRELFLERETLFTQIELALLCREHVLIVGPPGTAKSAVASCVLGRILDEKSGAPSLFSKQLSESTVQTDLIGPVDFKILTETGRTEYITDDGMLGATHAFLDEVFDGRDMLLRSILNVLHERELKHGRRVTPGRIECALMTSNRYLSEVLQRSPEVMLAFADRLSFICFVPKSFSRPSSRGVMLARAVGQQRPELKHALTLQQLDALQALVEKVKVPSVISEALEQLADGLERALLAQVVKLPDYVPTKYFSQRSTVKALWALKAAVVRDLIYRRPDRPLEATLEDLESLRHFFVLGGPSPAEVELLIKGASDPRERAQLEIIRVEHNAYTEAFEKVRADLGTGVEREADLIQVKEDLAVAEALAKNFTADRALQTARLLKDKLVPGPRHPENRAPLVSAARLLVGAIELRLGRGMAGQGEGRGGAALADAFADTLELCRAVPELREKLPALAKRIAAFCRQALEQVALTAEGAEFEPKADLDALAVLAESFDQELQHVGALATQLSPYLADSPETLLTLEEAIRRRAAQSLRRQVRAAFLARKRQPGAVFETLTLESRQLAQLERAIRQVSPHEGGIREELLGPLGARYAQGALEAVQFDRIEVLSRQTQAVMELLRREGISAEAAMAESRALLEERLAQYVARQEAAKAPGAAQAAAAALSGASYQRYRSEIAAHVRDGDLAALLQLDAQLRGAAGRPFLSEAARRGVGAAELASLDARVSFLRAWLDALVGALPPPDKLEKRAEAEALLDKLVASRLPLLVLREGELLRIGAALDGLAEQDPETAGAVSALKQRLGAVQTDFSSFSKRLLDVRAQL